MRIHIRQAVLKDLDHLSDLYRKAMNKTVQHREILWRFKDNPLINQNLWNFIAEDETGKLMAHSAFIPMKYRFNGKEYTGALSAGSMALPLAGGWFAPLYTMLESHVLEQGVDFLFAFPNPASFPFFVKLFQYKQYHLALLTGAAQTLIAQHTFISPNTFLCNTMHEAFIRWRVTLHPVNSYHYHAVSGAGLIHKPYQNHTKDLLAWILKPEHPVPVTHLPLDLTSGINFYSTHKQFTQLCLKAGIKQQSTPNRLVVKIINPQLKHAEFFLQMIDSDVF